MIQTAPTECLSYVRTVLGAEIFRFSTWPGHCNIKGPLKMGQTLTFLVDFCVNKKKVPGSFIYSQYFFKDQLCTILGLGAIPLAETVVYILKYISILSRPCSKG
jgi:hypothetical protein